MPTKNNSKSKLPTVGWIGAGRMGYEMAARLAKAGVDTLVWNRTKAKADPLKAYGAKVATKVTELASRDVVFCMVSTWKDVKEVMTTLLSGKAKPKMVIECSSISLEGSAELREMLDIPVLSFMEVSCFHACTMGEKFALVVPNEKFVPAPYRQKARMERIEAMFVPDQDVQIAQIMTGGIDVMRDPSPDHVAELQKNKNLEVSAFDSDTMIYLQFDAMGRSGNKAVQDARVPRGPGWARLSDHSPVIADLERGHA